MSGLLKTLVEEWKRVPEYKDVDAEYWEPNQPLVEECPEGCEVEIYEATGTNWGRIEGRDAYRQTRICRKHGFARIYVISGVTAAALNWNPENV
jgi:hypothetical protein